ncbi:MULTISPECIES: hypothetical protein [unclassified Streptomyces]|uniref:hypothetical protein n=1 Tax=unclassified Streptomyces TaxID=2593676 RepID=UPI00225510B0|nr:MULTISPECIES: hypothetical protein [unclassified Streptomyces]WSP58276.1 hypothetical protein OG306_30740 [Streptomyces sp. NBC_01241]WSU21147.1 hypothetical protein OG508_09265 [Streptomyces sp. NBC_01108]MCX4790025.1 hypothetical protein [Streptomyces sp. NBC_01221]MCX4794249.1 hypothetical protein [Streptomyces sp. NBC_01242]WSP62069.1 hypothetical protein OG466_09330 [Streptomyces sp. NBC_01240]
MGSLFEELEAREAAARVRVEELEAEIASVSAKLELAREGLERLRIARETVAEVLAEMPGVTVDAGGPPTGERVASAYAGAERQVIGVLTVPNWQPGMGPDVLPAVYRHIVEVVADEPGPVRAKQIVPRIGLPAETGKIEGARSKLKRLVERGWLDEDAPGRRADLGSARGPCRAGFR